MITDDHKINWQDVASSNVIKAPVGIYPIFKLLFDKRVMLDVYFDGHPERYNSYIVEVDAKKCTFTLDEILPRKGHYNLCAGNHFTIKVIYQGVHIAFENHSSSYLRHDQYDYVYIFPFPEKLIHQQRRQAFRVPVSTSTNFANTLRTTPQTTPLCGRVINLSAGGCRIEYPVAMRILLKQGSHYPELQLELPTGDRVSCGATLMNLIEDKHRLYAGFQFMHADIHTQRLIDKGVAFLQRESTRSALSPY